MNEEVKRIVNDLLCCIENRCYNCKMLSGSATCWQIVGKQAADLIEDLAAKNARNEIQIDMLKHDKEELNGIIDVLTARCKAAERDIEVLLQDGGSCDRCSHFQTENCNAGDDTYCNAKWREPCEESGGKDDGTSNQN